MLSHRSNERLEGVHLHLVRVVRKAITLTEVDFTVLEGVRSIDRQRHLVSIGASWTMNSRHLTGHAVDLGAWVDGQVVWDWPLYHIIAEAMFNAAKICDVQIDWGGHWKNFTDVTGRVHYRADGPHYQLPWSDYPLEDREADDMQAA